MCLQQNCSVPNLCEAFGFQERCRLPSCRCGVAVAFALLIPLVLYVIYYRIWVLKELQTLGVAKARAGVKGAGRQPNLALKYSLHTLVPLGLYRKCVTSVAVERCILNCCCGAGVISGFAVPACRLRLAVLPAADHRLLAPPVWHRGHLVLQRLVLLR